MDWTSLFSGITQLGTTITKAVIGPQVISLPAGSQVVGQQGNTIITQQATGLGSIFGTGGSSSIFTLLIIVVGIFLLFEAIEK